MNRRNVLISIGALSIAGVARAETIKPLNLTDAEWKKRLPPAAYQVLRKEATERPYSSPLNNEKRKGTFVCLF